jgi:hypothetical protein
VSESGHHRTRTGLLQGVCGREEVVDDGAPSGEDPLQVKAKVKLEPLYRERKKEMMCLATMCASEGKAWSVARVVD